MDSRTWVSRVTSQATAKAIKPVAFSLAATGRLRLRVLPTTETLAPSRANKSAVALPMPEVAPLIQATLPSSLPIAVDDGWWMLDDGVAASEDRGLRIENRKNNRGHFC